MIDALPHGVPRAVRHATAVLALLAGASGALGQSVSMSGSLGASKALLMIDGSPRTVAVGSTVQGVKLVSTGSQESVVEVAGKRVVLRLGASQVNLGGGAGGESGTRIVLTAGLGGHFITSGSINGQSTQFMVDTGASVVSIGQADAERMGLKYKQGRPGYANTANGQVQVYNITLTSVRIGDVEIQQVAAIVLPAPMNHVLLGNSFLSRFQMTRNNDVMTLERRF